MKKRYFLLTLFIFFVMPRVSAFCGGKNYTDLQAKAYTTQFQWQFVSNEIGTKYFTVYIYNLDKDVVLIYKGKEYKYNNGNKIPIETYFIGGTNYEFELYGAKNSSCPGEFLYSKTLDIPKYNEYSERKECIEYEEFPLCNKWYKGYIDSEKAFLDNLDKYIESKKPIETEKPEEDNTIIDRIKKLFNEYPVVSVAVAVVLVGTSLTYTIIRINGRKNKIKLGTNK